MLKVNDITLRFKNIKLERISFELKKGEYFVILGKTGVGKTLLLETIAGRYLVNEGNILYNGSDITNFPPEKRRIGFLYQSYELFPHLTAEENILFPLKIQGLPLDIEYFKVLVENLGIKEILKREIVNLSGGEKQRIALCRLLIAKPPLILLDEPLSALDYFTKIQAKKLIKSIVKEYDLTVIHVTHDISEAFYFADKIGVMKEGRLKSIFKMDKEILERGEEFFYEYF